MISWNFFTTLERSKRLIANLLLSLGVLLLLMGCVGTQAVDERINMVEEAMKEQSQVTDEIINSVDKIVRYVPSCEEGISIMRCYVVGGIYESLGSYKSAEYYYKKACNNGHDNGCRALKDLP